VLSPAPGPPAWEETFAQSPVFDPAAPVPEPAFELYQTLSWQGPATEPFPNGNDSLPAARQEPLPPYPACGGSAVSEGTLRTVPLCRTSPNLDGCPRGHYIFVSGHMQLNFLNSVLCRIPDDQEL